MKEKHVCSTATHGFIASVSVVFLVFLLTVWAVREIQLAQHCTDYLKLAGDATTIEIASERLGIVVNYLNENSITSGNSSVLWNLPRNDIGIWHLNLVAARDNLETLPTGLSETDKTNTLIKLRETLLDGSIVTCPSNLSLFPYQRAFCFAAAMAFTASIVFGIMWLNRVL